MPQVVIGIDFGTESGRAVAANVSSGELMAVHSTAYPHGVIDTALPTGERLGDDWALQHPADYLAVLESSIPEVVRRAGVTPVDVIGIGIDFTSCTMLPVNVEGTPLCLLAEYETRPHSWVKLWKHHAAKQEAADITDLARQRGERFLSRYGGTISSEWMIPKILQILREDPDIYHAADRFLEAGDWIVSVLTGQVARNASGAGFKAMWIQEDGPSTEFFAALHPEFRDVQTTKLRGHVVPVGTRVGGLSAGMAQRLNLPPGISVAAAAVDAFAAVPGSGVETPGTMVMAMGTSTCHMVLADELHLVEGITGVVTDGILPGFYGYEAGQAAVGDIFGWFVDECAPDHIAIEARNTGVSVHALLERRAAEFAPGEAGLIALDWWNGNRSILADAGMTGLITGLTLATEPAELYRALIEATAFGTRRIVEQFVQSGVKVNELVASGGLPKHNKLLMQIYADVTARTIRVPLVEEPTALGAAVLAAAAVGHSSGGYDTVREAIVAMRCDEAKYYVPDPDNVKVYDRLYSLYCQLHDIFDTNRSLMHELRALRETVKSNRAAG